MRVFTSLSSMSSICICAHWLADFRERAGNLISKVSLQRVTDDSGSASLVPVDGILDFSPLTAKPTPLVAFLTLMSNRQTHRADDCGWTWIRNGCLRGVHQYYYHTPRLTSSSHVSTSLGIFLLAIPHTIVECDCCCHCYCILPSFGDFGNSVASMYTYY